MDGTTNGTHFKPQVLSQVLESRKGTQLNKRWILHFRLRLVGARGETWKWKEYAWNCEHFWRMDQLNYWTTKVGPWHVLTASFSCFPMMFQHSKIEEIWAPNSRAFHAVGSPFTQWEVLVTDFHGNSRVFCAHPGFGAESTGVKHVKQIYVCVCFCYVSQLALYFYVKYIYVLVCFCYVSQLALIFLCFMFCFL